MKPKIISFLESELQKDFPAKVRNIDQNILIDVDSGKPGTTLLLCSHIDTVPTGEAWTKDPFAAVEEGGKIFGLGANDALASVVSIVEATKRAQNKIKSGRLLVALVREEEKGDNGFCLIEPKIPRYDFAIFGEPTQMRICSTMRGNIQVKVSAKGTTAHASRPWEGKNAMDEAV